MRSAPAERAAGSGPRGRHAGITGTVPTSLTLGSAPRDRPFPHVNAPQRTWLPGSAPARSGCERLPRSYPSPDLRVRWGTSLPLGSSGLYGHYRRTPAACQGVCRAISPRVCRATAGRAGGRPPRPIHPPPNRRRMACCRRVGAEFPAHSAPEAWSVEPNAVRMVWLEEAAGRSTRKRACRHGAVAVPAERQTGTPAAAQGHEIRHGRGDTPRVLLGGSGGMPRANGTAPGQPRPANAARRG